MSINKQTLRKETLTVRRNLSPDAVTNYSNLIFQHVVAHPLYQNASVVMIYMDYKNEVQTKKLLEHTIQSGKVAVLPVVDPVTNTLVLVRYQGASTPMTLSGFGILEPVVTPDNQVAFSDVSLVLAPGVAFDPFGYRLGYGGGYYDKLLSGADRSRVKVYAICFDCQVVASVPHEAYDMRMDGLFTESGCVVITE